MEAELAHQETAAALDGLARGRWWLSDIPGAIEAWERAFIAYRRADLDEPAVHVAVLLSRDHAEGLGNGAVANGRLARAKDLLGGQPDSIEWRWVTLVESERAGQPDLLSFCGTCCAATRTSPRPSRPWSPCTWPAARPPSRRSACTAA